VSDFFSRAPLEGANYLKTLARLHVARRPSTYLEIGVHTGRSLALAECPAIAIDPAPRLDPSAVRKHWRVFEMTSDAFFAAHDPAAILGRPIDLAFIDGLHRFDAALRDFINCERHAAAGGVIVMDDCLPTDDYLGRIDPKDRSLAAKSSRVEAWAGDVWRVIAVLRRYRPDLDIKLFDAKPTGTAVIGRLDPRSTLLDAHYEDCLAFGRSMTLREFWSATELLPAEGLKMPWYRRLRLRPSR